MEVGTRNGAEWTAPGLNGVARLGETLRAARALTLYSGVLDDEAGRAMLAMLEASQAGDDLGASRAYATFFTALAAEVELGSAVPVGNAWQNHLLDRILSDENPFSRKAELRPLDQMGPGLASAASRDLLCLQALCRVDPTDIWELQEAREAGPSLPLVSDWSSLRPLTPNEDGDGARPRSLLKQAILAAEEWSCCLPALAAHYATHSTGALARFRAFRWEEVGRLGALVGVAHPDPVRLGDLIGYERERSLLLTNTEHFLAGYPANNVLLYGDRGTGKSSTIKALLSEYGDRGLRLVEVPKDHLRDLPAILSHLRDRRLYFILYVDDLSFDEHETDYKRLKAVLEGGLESRPDNVLVYATSNRRHLVRERFGDRDETAPDEIHRRDTVEEKLSLGDRFGITIVFTAPDQERYLSICAALAERRGLAIDTGALRRRALQWSVGQKGLSGRTARQFIDFLAADLAMGGSASVL